MVFHFHIDRLPPVKSKICSLLRLAQLACRRNSGRERFWLNGFAQCKPALASHTIGQFVKTKPVGLRFLLHFHCSAGFFNFLFNFVGFFFFDVFFNRFRCSVYQVFSLFQAKTRNFSYNLQNRNFVSA